VAAGLPESTVTLVLQEAHGEASTSVPPDVMQTVTHASAVAIQEAFKVAIGTASFALAIAICTKWVKIKKSKTSTEQALHV
jgi:hypothetical protein